MTTSATAPSTSSPRSNVGTGEVITDYRKRHAAVDVLAFFKKIDRSVPRRYDVHVILDNLSAHMAPEVTDWLAEPAQRRWHLHFTPTASSWLNLVERWFALLTDKRLRRGVFGSLKELTAAIRLWAKHWNADPQPFIWTKAADEITRRRRARHRRPRAHLDLLRPRTRIHG